MSSVTDTAIEYGAGTVPISIRHPAVPLVPLSMGPISFAVMADWAW